MDLPIDINQWIIKFGNINYIKAILYLIMILLYINLEIYIIFMGTQFSILLKRSTLCTLIELFFKNFFRQR